MIPPDLPEVPTGYFNYLLTAGIHLPVRALPGLQTQMVEVCGADEKLPVVWRGLRPKRQPNLVAEFNFQRP